MTPPGSASDQAAGAPVAPVAPVAAFDFDGTITTRDSMLLFLTALRSRTDVVRSFLRRSPQLVAALHGGDARDRAKRLVVRDLLGGLPCSEADAAARRTAVAIERSLIRPDMRARLRWHQREGHRVVVVSASFEGYVGPVAGSLGVRDVVATRWELDGSDVLTGEIDGPNIRGGAKVDGLAALLGEGFQLEYAYGDSAGDDAMLARARHPVRIGRRPLPEPGRGGSGRRESGQ
jgi:phosphatidylglycerophosphatase C